MAPRKPKTTTPHAPKTITADHAPHPRGDAGNQALKSLCGALGREMTADEYTHAAAIADLEQSLSGETYGAPQLAFIVAEQMGWEPRGTPEDFTLGG